MGVLQLSDLRVIKERIYNDNKIETILEELGCEHIRKESGGRLYTAQLPPHFNSNNRRSVQVKDNESLTSHIRSRGIHGDIYNLIGYILYDLTDNNDVANHLFKIKKWICDTLGYGNIDFEPSEKRRDWTYFLKDIRKKRKREVEEKENEPIDELYIEQYERCPNVWWKQDGISYRTQMEFGVRWDSDTKRIVFPVRDRYGRLIGVKGRYMGNDEYTLNEQKYIYLKPCNKSYELYGLDKAMNYIMDKKEIIVVEAAKSVMMLWQYGYRNVVSIEGDSITPEQIKLIKDLGLEVTPVFVWDKGKNKEFIKRQLESFKGRQVYYVYDTMDLLEDKMSPVDLGYDVWYTLMSECKYKLY